MTTSACPSLVELEAAMRAPDVAPDLSEHLAQCRRCARRMEDLRSNEALLQELSSLDEPAIASSGGPADIPGYEIVEPLHAGAQGAVCKAVQTATSRLVAIKTMRAGTLATARQRRRFEREIELVASLRHPNIVSVFDSGVTAGGEHFFAMELVEGVPLDAYLAAADLGEAGSRQRTRALLRLFAKICAGVACAHQRGVIHRDLKPANIMVDADGEPRILDFGLARAVAEDEGEQRRVTRAGEFLGTLAYAAPEQASGDPSRIDVRTDVYSLGAMLYEALTGRLPHDMTGSLDRVLQRIASGTPARPLALARRGTLPARIDGELETIVLKALASDRDRRYESAGALRADIERYLDGAVIDARRDSAWYILRKTVMRHRWRAAGAGAFLVLLAASAIVAAVLYGRAAAEATKLRQINMFWEDTLGSAAPRRAGEQVTVGDLLDEARPWATIAFADQPRLEATIRMTLGNSYRALGRYDDAERELTTALRLFEQAPRPRALERASAINALGLVARERGDLDEALNRMMQAMELRRDVLGQTHPVLATSWQNLGMLMARAGRDGEAEQYMRTALDIRAAAFGMRHPDTAMIQFQLADLLRRQQRLEEAIELHRQVLAARRDGLPPGHPDLPRSLLALGRSLVDAQRPSEAEPLLRECRRLRSEAYGEGDWRTAEAAGALGACLRAAGHPEEAEPILSQAADILVGALGPADPRTELVLEQLIALLEAGGDRRRADEYRAMLLGAGSP